MRNLCWSVLLVAALFLGACGSEPEKVSAPAPAEKKQEPVVSETAARQVAAVQQQVEEKVAEVQQQVEAQTEQLVTAAKDATAAVEKSVQQQVEQASAEVAKMVTPSILSSPAAMTKPASKADPTVSSPATSVPPERLTLKASFGDIDYPHGQHARSFACSTCHGDAVPGRFGLTKERAHPLCRDCHKEMGKGPSSCRDCHKK